MNPINLQKIVVDLIKSKGAQGQKANVKLFIDRSVSIRELFDNGTIQQTAERILPIAMAFSDDQSIPMYTFEDRCKKLGDIITPTNYQGFINAHTQDLDYGGTNYAPVIEAAMRDCGTTLSKVITYMKHAKRGGIMGIFGKDSQKETKETIQVGPAGYNAIPTLAIVLTDGDNDDKDQAERAIIKAATYPIFFQFVGVQGNPKPDFRFLKQVDTMKGRFIDNVNLAEVTPYDLVNRSDDSFYRMLLTEFTEQYLPAAKAQFLIK
jgi:hypothetical protein